MVAVRKLNPYKNNWLYGIVETGHYICEVVVFNGSVYSRVYHILQPCVQIFLVIHHQLALNSEFVVFNGSVYS